MRGGYREINRFEESSSYLDARSFPLFLARGGEIMENWTGSDGNRNGMEMNDDARTGQVSAKM